MIIDVVVHVQTYDMRIHNRSTDSGKTFLYLPLIEVLRKANAAQIASYVLMQQAFTSDTFVDQRLALKQSRISAYYHICSLSNRICVTLQLYLSQAWHGGAQATSANTTV